jgi:DNA-binding NtrC family response regulator
LAQETKTVHGREQDGRVEAEKIASRSSATLLITAFSPARVEELARRIHLASDRAGAPFVLLPTHALPIEPVALRERCSALLDAAIGGSLLMVDVEAMPVLVQEVFLDLVAELQAARARSAAVRLIAGTTVPLLERVTGGTFSERLFYRLNVIHIVATADAASTSIRR